jgi:polysaccharide export outer membrane protein
MRTKFTVATVLALMITGLTGCFSSNPKDIEAFSKPANVNVTADKYILQPPDEIQVFCKDIPEINEFRERIRPDGKVSFEKLGDVEAAGKTPGELAEAIVKKAAKFYTLSEDYPVNIQVVVYQSDYYYVLGQVSLPGAKIYTGRDTFLTAVSQAAPTPLAWIHRIQVIRPSAGKNVAPKIFEVDLDDMIVRGDTSKNVLLNEGDIIYVPPTVLAWVGLKVEEIIRPIARAFSGYYIIGTGGAVRYGY